MARNAFGRNGGMSRSATAAPPISPRVASTRPPRLTGAARGPGGGAPPPPPLWVFFFSSRGPVFDRPWGRALSRAASVEGPRRSLFLTCPPAIPVPTGLRYAEGHGRQAK